MDIIENNHNQESKKLIAEKILARQPILDKHQRTVGYELLFRSSQNKNMFDPSIDGEIATLTVINSLISVGLHNVVGSNKAFINFSTELLLDQYYKLLPKEVIIIEILENIQISDKLVKVCKDAKLEGFTIALDDFFFKERIEELIKLTDIIKIDFMETSTEDIKKYAKDFKSKGKLLLAEKIETMAEFYDALNMGFDYFQGFFFSRPQIVSGHDIPAYKIRLVKLMKEIQMGADIEKMSDIISQDIALSWKLLKFINSAFFGFRSPISTVKRAAYMLGENELRRWINLIIISEIGIDSPLELIVQSTVRAKFAEYIGKDLGGEELALKAFTVGMFSLIDIILQKPMQEILEQIPLDEEIKKGILTEDTLLGNIMQIIINREILNFNEVRKLLNKINYSFHALQEAYINALIWSNKFLSSI